MKLAWKFFCITYLIVLIVAAGGVSALVKLASDTVFNEQQQTAISANTFAVRSFLTLVKKNIGDITDENLNYLSQQICDILESENIENLKISDYKTEKNELNVFERSTYIKETNDNKAVMIISYCVEVNEKKYIVTTSSDLSSAFSHRQMLWKYYRMIIIGISVISSILLYIIANFFTKPINRLSDAVVKITSGNYGECISVSNSSSEISILTENFNIMSASIKEKTEKLVEEAQKQSAFVANFTHELKTPMTSVIGYADLIRRYELDETEKQQAANIIYSEGKRLEQLSMTLLDLLMLKNNTITLNKISLKNFSEKISKSLQFTAEKYGVDLVINLPSICILANEALLTSLFYNLVDNACKASKKEEKVLIDSFINDRFVTIKIIDTGIGIDNNDISRITEPFYMVDKSRTRKSGGAGLGLSLCKMIAEIHNTELIFCSKRNKGTTVSFKLECEEEDENE